MYPYGEVMLLNLGEMLMKDLLDIIFTEHCINNYKPSWLNGLEIDRYYPSLRLAFEFQGEQHFRYSFSMYESHELFLTQVKNDLHKKEILKSKKICLIEVETNELTPELFFQKVSSSIMEPISSEISLSLRKKIRRYQKGVEIYYKKQMNEYIKNSLYFDFVSSPKYKEAAERFLSFSELTSDEKLLFCFLAIFSKNHEVQLTYHELKDFLKNDGLMDSIFTLLEKGFINFHPTFYLISLHSEKAKKTLDFIEKFITFIESKKIN
jgi:hypothetical protein